MLQNDRFTAFTASELLRENQQDGWGRGVKLTFLTFFDHKYLNREF